VEQPERRIRNICGVLLTGARRSALVAFGRETPTFGRNRDLCANAFFARVFDYGAGSIRLHGCLVYVPASRGKTTVELRILK